MPELSIVLTRNKLLCFFREYVPFNMVRPYDYIWRMVSTSVNVLEQLT